MATKGWLSPLWRAKAQGYRLDARVDRGQKWQNGGLCWAVRTQS